MECLGPSLYRKFVKTLQFCPFILPNFNPQVKEKHFHNTSNKNYLFLFNSRYIIEINLFSFSFIMKYIQCHIHKNINAFTLSFSNFHLLQEYLNTHKVSTELKNYIIKHSGPNVLLGIHPQIQTTNCMRKSITQALFHPTKT